VYSGRRVIVRLVPVAVLTVLLSGCLLAAPPLRGSYGVGGATGSVPMEPEEGPPRDVSAATRRDFRLAIAPLGLMPGRAFDASLGMAWENSRAGATRDKRTAIFGEVTWFGYGSRDAGIPARRGWRVGPSVTGDVVTDGSTDIESVSGGGLALGLLAELYGARAKSLSCQRNSCGTSNGESGIGLSIRAGIRRVGGETYAYSILSVEARLPTFFMVAGH
jgi:hypothetical protein